MEENKLKWIEVNWKDMNEIDEMDEMSQKNDMNEMNAMYAIKRRWNEMAL